MRKLLTDLFTNTDDFEVVGTARNGYEAIQKVKSLKPDLITMDINMPVMDGLTALEIIMKECPLPVVMFSSLTHAGADATIKALSLGAVDFIRKHGGAVTNLKGQGELVLAKCRVAARVKLQNNLKEPQIVKPSKSPLSIEKIVAPTTFLKPGTAADLSSERLIAIGTSTGGPRALQQIIPLLPKDLPCGVVIVQHMPAGFTKSLADRLNSLSQVFVKEAEHGDAVEAGKVYIAPGNYHMTVEPQGRGMVISLNQNPRVGNLRPAVDVLFQSVAAFGKRVIAVILTGMGSDGSKGMKYIKEAGGYSIGESESTATVYGMPKVAADMGLIDKVLPVDKIAAELIQQVRK
jgi:two-component system chemotaxis response regulator CheB